MARTVRETFRQYLPGGGRDVLGNPKQGKTRVVANINVTSYTQGGEDLAPIDLSLTTIDHIDLRVVNECRNMEGSNAWIQAVYADAVNQFYLVNTDMSGDRTELAGAATEVVTVIAEGDSAYDVELQ